MSVLPGLRSRGYIKLVFSCLQCGMWDTDTALGYKVLAGWSAAGPEQLQRCPLRSRSEAPWSLPRGSSSSHGFAAASGEHSRFPTSKVRPLSRPRTPSQGRLPVYSPFEADLCVLLWHRGTARSSAQCGGVGGERTFPLQPYAQACFEVQPPDLTKPFSVDTHAQLLDC